MADMSCKLRLIFSALPILFPIVLALGGCGDGSAPPLEAGGLGETGGATIPAASTGGAGGQALSPVDTADTGGPTVSKDGGLSVDSGEADVAYSAPACGDGITVLPELCDDGNRFAGDGCSPTCKVEVGFKCSGSPSVCAPTVCGDGKVEGAEGCDDGNTMPFDGCSQDCQLEPDCSGSACTSACGDGVVLGAEECDDGNKIDGDGCSKDCKIETGFVCTQPPLGNKMMVPVIYRDFRFQNPPEFEAGVNGPGSVVPGIVQETLDADGKPVYSGIGGASHITSTTTFAEWYRTTTGVNHATASTLALWANGQGGYVNRYGANGEQWNVTATAYYCGSVGSELTDANGAVIPCTFQYPQFDAAPEASPDASPTVGQTDCQKMEALGYTQLAGSCRVSGGTYSAQYIVNKVDGNPLFFPIDADTFSADQLEGAQVPSVPLGLYDATGSWPWDVDDKGNKRMHNFSFTSEVRYWFKYEANATYNLDFIGDDDVWVFINKKLAVDLGGVHIPVSGSVTLDAAAATEFGLIDGNLYEIAVFQAERQTTGSSYKLTLSGFNTAPSQCSSGIPSSSQPGDGGAG